VTGRVDPLDAFAAWPRSAEEATPDALLRHALVRAVAADTLARELAREGLDVRTQNARFVGYLGWAVLLRDQALADPTRDPWAHWALDPPAGTIAERGVTAPRSVQTGPYVLPEGSTLAGALWRLLSDGADAPTLAARWLRDCGIDPDSVAEAAVGAYRARRAQVWPPAKAGAQ
jgi:hypothetical protein